MELSTSKIKTIDELSKISEALRSQNKVLVTTNGSFDILHSAHLNLLEKSKQEGDILIVLTNSDASIKRFKGDKRPIISEKERARMLAGLACIDYVAIFEEDTPLNALKKIKPNKHVKGGSFLPERIKEEKELLESWNGEFKTFPLEAGYSTTNIIEKIIENHKE